MANRADLPAPPPRCGFCHNRVNDDARETCDGCSTLCLCEGSRVPLTHVPVDGMGPCCDECAGEIRREAAIEEAWGRSEAVQATMTCDHALRLAVEIAMGGDNLLNGADEECDVCDEPRGHEPTGLINREDAVRIGGGAPDDDEAEAEDSTVEVDALRDGQPCSVSGCGRVVGDCPHWAPSYAVAKRTEAA